MGLANWGGEHASRNVSEPDSPSLRRWRWPVCRLVKPAELTAKQQVNAAARPPGVVGDSARGQISREAWETLPGVGASRQHSEGRHNRGEALQGDGEARSSEEAA